MTRRCRRCRPRCRGRGPRSRSSRARGRPARRAVGGRGRVLLAHVGLGRRGGLDRRGLVGGHQGLGGRRSPPAPRSSWSRRRRGGGGAGLLARATPSPRGDSVPRDTSSWSFSVAGWVVSCADWSLMPPRYPIRVPRKRPAAVASVGTSSRKSAAEAIRSLSGSRSSSRFPQAAAPAAAPAAVRAQRSRSRHPLAFVDVAGCRGRPRRPGPPPCPARSGHRGRPPRDRRARRPGRWPRPGPPPRRGRRRRRCPRPRRRGSPARAPRAAPPASASRPSRRRPVVVRQRVAVGVRRARRVVGVAVGALGHTVPVVLVVLVRLGGREGRLLDVGVDVVGPAHRRLVLALGRLGRGALRAASSSRRAASRACSSASRAFCSASSRATSARSEAWSAKVDCPVIRAAMVSASVRRVAASTRAASRFAARRRTSTTTTTATTRMSSRRRISWPVVMECSCRRRWPEGRSRGTTYRPGGIPEPRADRPNDARPSGSVEPQRRRRWPPASRPCAPCR